MMKTQMKKISSKILGLAVLMGIASSAIASSAHAYYYFHIVNPDPNQYKILWNGPGPNKVMYHNVNGKVYQVACWLINGFDSRMPNAGLATEKEAVIWAEPKVFAKGDGTYTPYMALIVDLGKPQVDGGSNTWWVGLPGQVIHTYDCDNL